MGQHRPLPYSLLNMYIYVIIFIFLIKETSQNTRNKRQIQPDLPRILTQNGHLVFQTGMNHNITFRSTNGGFINVNGDNLAVITQTVNQNKLAIDQLRTSPTTSPTLETRLTTIEGRLNNLQPTGEVQTQLLTLGHRIDLVQATMPSNIDTRLTNIESSLNNLQPSGQVATLINQLTTRITTLEGRVRRSSTSRSTRRRVTRLNRKVNQLETTVNTLQQLLTTNECSSNPCRNGGTCVDTYNGFFCRCPDTFQGPNCDDDVNECAIYAGTDLGCQNGATCTNTVGGFTCQCAANWHGIRCTESHDDCTGASSAELCGHGTCVNSPRVQPGQPKYTCICEDGWTTAGSDPACTVDVNECTGNRPPCSTDPLVPCINLPGSFTCGSCPSGYNGNGFTCNDVNECAVNNGGCSTSPMVQCVNTPGSRTCGPCPAGYQGNGVTCTWVGLCQDNNGGCHPLAACTESPGFEGRTCTCQPGYVGNGVGSVGCVSQGPVTGPCGSNPCMNGAACQNVGDSSYRCVCQPGYTDQNCQTNLNECESNPCQNGGSCTDRVNGYACQCTDSYTGSNCEVEQQSCGGYLNGETGTFRYPMVPGTQYPHSVSCAWSITTTYGKILMITFPTFNIEAHPQCNYDHLQIHDGPTASSYMIGKYCGSTPPNNGQPINSTHHQLYFWFLSDTSVASDGFTVQWTSAEPVCGGNLAGSDHGEFSSPGYPGNYPHDRDCLWTITVAPGNNILFTFATLALETHPDCNYDYLEIRDGGLDTSPLLQRFCNSTTPPPLLTTGPTAWVKFHSDYSQSDTGFHITYAARPLDAGCGGTFTDETGILISPNYPNAYNHDAQCVWIITVNELDRITLTFTNLDLEGHINCQYDYIEVRDGSNENAALIGRYCGDTMPVPLTTSGNVLYVKFVSDSSVTRAGFRATWQVSCGGVFTSPVGVVRSPYHPNSYPGNRQCEYFINQAPGNRVTLSFNSFDIEGGSSADICDYDYLEIRDGGSPNSPLVGTYCGIQAPDPITTTANLMYLKFVTDGSIHNQGFEAAYLVAESSCGGPLTGNTDSFQSPGHPNVYPHGVNCTWSIRVEPGLVVRLTFHTFSIESHPNCNYDSVAVFDNSIAVETSLIGRYCGSTVPPVVTSTNNVLTVLFTSDVSIANEGFSASYVALNASTLCGREYTDPTGVITSPNFPNSYPHQRECTWTITAQEGNQILVNITDFSLESHPNCNYDYLEIRNGGFPSSPLVGKYCGTTIDRIIVSHSNKMYIKLVTDNSLSAPGFRLMYDATSTGCGADLTTPTGSFVSPNYPMAYGHNAECFWTVTTSRGSRVQLVFVDIDIEAHVNCNYDYVEVRDGDSNGALIGRYCGSSTPDLIVSTTNRMWIRYRTDYSVSGRGFHVFYVSLCSSTLTDFSGVIESPNFPNPYPHNRNCTWIIDTTMGNTVNISFSHFDIESHSNCQYDYLQINDGESESSASLGTFCGMDLPPVIASTTDKVWINFRSDFSVANNGFRLEYITSGCGGYLRTPTGSFNSPNYPNPYPHRRQCEWTIVADNGFSVQLTIETFDLESATNCVYDVLEVYGGPDDTAPRLAQLCHTQNNPQVLTSTGNYMFVRFKSDYSISGNGFSATYETTTGGCGGNISTPTGSIHSKNYPNNYPHNTDCEWLITVEDRLSVELTFIDFDVEGSSDCRYDYVALYDGPNTNWPELMKYCGNTLPVPVKYRSHSNQMYVRMRTDQSISARGFKADFATSCGGILNAENNGDIFSPSYPSSYPRRSNCSWLIQADHASDRITLIFTHMDVENSNDCRKDYVQVLDGNDEQAPEVGKFCGNTSPSPITSQGSALFVIFVSDYAFQGSGFRATYTKSTSACGGDFTSQSGAFTSPGYPNSYPINTECVWTVGVSPGNRVQLSFSFFNIEDHVNCNYDYIELHEGQVGGPLLGRFCGNTIPSNLTAYNGIWMKFRSDDSATGQGFVAQYSAVYGGDLSGTSGQIASPLYPQQYPHRVDYMWTVTVPTNMRVRVTFTTIDMESTMSECIFDFLKIRDGGTSDSPIGGTYCGTTLPDVYVSTTNQIHLEFHSDWSSTGQGFLLTWEATSDQPISTVPPTGPTTPVPGCGGILNVTDIAQTFTSPGYPSGYLDNLDCRWSLQSPVGSRVWLNITDIDVESHSSCNYDTVRIYNAATATGVALGTFCGRVGNTAPIVSTRNQASVKFTTDYSLNRTGFQIQYKSVCGGVVRAMSGVLQSPGYPNNYPVSSNCSWLVVVPTGRTIRVQFNSNFNIQGNQGSCGGDYLLLLNGQQLTSPPLGNADGKYCGSTAPQIMETASNYLTADFVTDNSGSAPGFSLAFAEVRVTCGGQLRLDASTTSGIFTSPNYPQNYPHNVDCVWIITAPANERIQIDFIEDFSIEMHTNCNWDFIEIRDGGTVNSESLGKLCGYTHPNTVVSTGNVLYARFRTDSSVPRIGFKAQYKIATCGGAFSGNSGTFTSPSYPANYETNSECIWVVRGPVGHFLTFTFTAFNLPMATNCTLADYVEIREINSTGPVLAQLCGSNIPQPVMTSNRYGYVKFVSDGQGGQFPGFSLNFEASVEECGGDLYTPFGSFQSPNFPGNYPHSRICEWRITVQPGRRISFSFDPFNIEDHSFCRYDYVAVFNGIYPNSPMQGRYCGDNVPTIVETTGNMARVLFRTDGSVSNGGFRAFYTSMNEALCGGELTLAPGNITSPGYGPGSNYTNNLECVWTIRNQGAVNTSIVIRINDMKLEPHNSCRYDFLEAREGDSITGVLLDQYCGNNTIHPPIISPIPAMWLRFKSDASVVNQGFHLSYNFTQCGGILSYPTGIITSPNYPNDYDHNDACAWTIMAPEGTQISVDFTDFNIETHPNCNYDYLELFNGPYASSPSIGRFCGTTPPTGFRSQSNTIRIVFFTDYSMSGHGFRMTYAFTTQGCGGLLHSPNGNFSTPNYPSSYPHNSECVWDINVESGYIIKLTFNPPFDMEHHGACDYDYVEVNNVLSNGTMVALGRWCENVLPPVTMSTGNRLVVKFRSDSSTNGNGFSARWETACGGVLTNSQGFLTSPGYPGQYSNNLRCNYSLIMDPQHYTVLSFDPNNFNIETGRNCGYDYVAVYAGNNSNGRLLGKFCGQTAPQPVTALGEMYIEFWTDGSIVADGFRAYYTASQCGGVFTDAYGSIETPTGPANYHNNQNCTWSITVQQNRVIDFKFQVFDLEAHSSCNYDYLDIFDGPSLSSPLIGRYCGNVVPTSLIRSSSNTMTINFVTDMSVVRAGFRGVYRTTYGPVSGCGGTLNTTSGVLRSVDGDGDGQYENDLDCRWTIIGANNKAIRLNIQGMDIETNPNCIYDYLMIYDGMTMEDPLIGQYCGTNYPPQIISTSNVLYVQFFTDGSITGPGFNATFVQQDALCGGTYTSSLSPQVITSPSYPNAFRQDVRCRWTLDAPADNSQVEVKVTALNLQTTDGCSPEYLEIRDYPLGARGRVVHACGVTLPAVFDSFSRTVQINYAATSGSSTGFSLTYKTATCNRAYTGSSGQIFSPGYPGAYPQNSNCRFSVQAPTGTTVSIYFNAFQIEPHPDCNYDYLEILSGAMPNASPIRKVCGWVLPDPVFVSSNIVTFNFITDTSIAHPGYDISYTATTQGVGCGGTLTGMNGSLTSPGYPGNYTSASTCTWLIQVPARRVITLTFTDMRMFDPVNCNTDYLIVYDGNNDVSNQFARFCGAEIPAAMTTSNNVAFVKFVSDGVGTSVGFRMTFTS